VTHKLLMNYTWWLNRKDADGNNVFEGGFLGLDNISVYDRSQPLPPGFSLKQADATGWMAMFALNMTMMCLELNARTPTTKISRFNATCSFSGIAKTIAGGSGVGVSLWDDVDGFFKDVVVGPDGSAQRIDVFSWVGLIPVFACEIVDQRLLNAAPKFHRIMTAHRYGPVRRDVRERVPRPRPTRVASICWRWSMARSSGASCSICCRRTSSCPPMACAAYRAFMRSVRISVTSTASGVR
jgi:hypothetical protein